MNAEDILTAEDIHKIYENARRILYLLPGDGCSNCGQMGLWAARRFPDGIAFEFRCLNCRWRYQYAFLLQDIHQVVSIRVLAERIRHDWKRNIPATRQIQNTDAAMPVDDIDTQILKGRVSREVQELIYRNVEGEEMTPQEEWTADVIDVINEILGLGIDLHPAWESAPEGRKIATACELAGVERAVFVKSAARLVSERYPDRPGLEGKLLKRWRRSQSLPGMILTGWEEYRKEV